MEESNGHGLHKSNRTNNHHPGGTFYIAGTLLASFPMSLHLLSATSLGPDLLSPSCRCVPRSQSEKVPELGPGVCLTLSPGLGQCSPPASGMPGFALLLKKLSRERWLC